jgi:hypothetical protein
MQLNANIFLGGVLFRMAVGHPLGSGQAATTSYTRTHSHTETHVHSGTAGTNPYNKIVVDASGDSHSSFSILPAMTIEAGTTAAEL